jgi:hypothetical protein
MKSITAQERSAAASNWIRFLRGYGPVPRNENMYDEFIRRSAKRLGVIPLDFEHPAREEVLDVLRSPIPTSVVLTGTAGDGKTYLCRQVWEALGGDPALWQSKEPLLSATIDVGDELPGAPGDQLRQNKPGANTLHIIRDLSAWAPQRGVSWDPKREAVLQRSPRCPSRDRMAGSRPRFVTLLLAPDRAVDGLRQAGEEEFVSRGLLGPRRPPTLSFQLRRRRRGPHRSPGDRAARCGCTSATHTSNGHVSTWTKGISPWRGGMWRRREEVGDETGTMSPIRGSRRLASRVPGQGPAP